MPAKPDPDLVAAALEAVAQGNSYREIAEALDVSEGSIRRWAKLAGVKPRAPVPAGAVELVAPHAHPAPFVAPPAEAAHMAPEPCGPPPPAMDPTDLLGSLRAMLVDQARQMAEFRAIGSVKPAQAAAANWGKLALLLKQVEASADEDATTLKIPRAELEQARAAIAARRAAVAARPMLCAECSRALSVSQGLGRKE